jgi:hypothetical protein
LTSQQFIQAVWAIALGIAAPWVIALPAWRLIDRWRDRKALREAEARLRAWEAAHPLEPEDEAARLARIRHRLWLESLAPHARAAVLDDRLAAAEREARARAILDAERRAARDGTTRPADEGG